MNSYYFKNACKRFLGLNVLLSTLYGKAWVVFTGGSGDVPVTEFRGMAPNGLFCADVLRPLDLIPSLTLPTHSHIPPWVKQNVKLRAYVGAHLPLIDLENH